MANYVFIATSLDGFIARKNNSVDFLSKYSNYGFEQFYKPIDTVILGNTTAKLFHNEYEGKNCYVFSRKKKGNLNYFNGTPKKLIKSLDKNHKNIWLVGGANLVNQFLKARLVDEIIITIVPILLGQGIPLFDESYKEFKLVMRDKKSYAKGLVQIHYEVK